MLYNQDFRKLVLYSFKQINSDDIVKYAKLRGGQLKLFTPNIIPVQSRKALIYINLFLYLVPYTLEKNINIITLAKMLYTL